MNEQDPDIDDLIWTLQSMTPRKQSFDAAQLFYQAGMAAAKAQAVGQIPASPTPTTVSPRGNVWRSGFLFVVAACLASIVTAPFSYRAGVLSAITGSNPDVISRSAPQSPADTSDDLSSDGLSSDGLSSDGLSSDGLAKSRMLSARRSTTKPPRMSEMASTPIPANEHGSIGASRMETPELEQQRIETKSRNAFRSTWMGATGRHPGATLTAFQGSRMLRSELQVWPRFAALTRSSASSEDDSQSALSIRNTMRCFQDEGY